MDDRHNGISATATTINNAPMSPRTKKKRGIKSLLSRVTPKVGRRTYDKSHLSGDLDLASKTSTMRSSKGPPTDSLATAEEQCQQFVDELGKSSIDHDEEILNSAPDGQLPCEEQTKGSDDEIDAGNEEKEPEMEGRVERLDPLISILETRVSSLELKLKELEATEAKRRQSLSALMLSKGENGVGNGGRLAGAASDSNLSPGSGSDGSSAMTTAESAWRLLLPATVGAVVGGGVAVAAILKSK